MIVVRVHNHQAGWEPCTPSCPVHPLHGEEGPTSIEELLEENRRLRNRVADLESEIRTTRRSAW